MDYFRNLPEDITLDILPRLPAESTLDCKSVCKTWNYIVSHHPSFSKMQLHHLTHPSTNDDSGKLDFLVLAYPNYEKEIFYYIEYNENHESTPILRITRMKFTSPFRDTTVLSSCDGLVCFSEGLSVCVCNPITREYVMLPQMSFDSKGYIYGKCSIGYVSSTNEYKVVRMNVSRTSIEVHICTLSSGNGWRNLGKFTFKFDTYTWDVAGVFLNEAIYWLDDELEMIIVFDLAEEKFSEHLSPPPLPDIYWRYDKIGVLDGFLSIAIRPDDKGDGICDIWLLRNKNNNHDMKERDERQSLGWSKEFWFDGRNLLAITKSKCVLSYCGSYLHSYHRKTSTWKRLMQLDSFYHVSPHKNTLISLKELGEEDTKTMESVDKKP